MHGQALTYCRQTAVLPVLQLNDAAAAVDIAHALYEGGLPVLEITLRTTPAARALAVISAVAAALPQATIAAGSVLTADHLRAAKDAGAKFAVSPGATDELLEADILPLLPGAQTASEIMRLSARGWGFAKFFPAVAAGGLGALRALAGPLPHIKFCPTGGITPGNAADFLALPNVVCVGGSWLVAEGDDTAAIHAKAQEAAQFAAQAASSLK